MYHIIQIEGGRLMENMIFLCRPDQNHWCVRCCEFRRCHKFGRLGDGKRGCLEYHSDSGRTDFCKSFNCLSPETSPEDIEELRKIIRSFREGEFNIQDALDELIRRKQVSKA